MRDYKNVRVPKKYRAGAGRADQQPTIVRRRTASQSTRKVVRTQVPKSGAIFLKLVFLVMAAGVCLLGWRTYQWTERTGIFQITGIDVQGVRQLSDADVEAIAGIFSGQNIFRADIQGAAKRAQANPWIKEIGIYRKLPNRISMVIEERTPAVIVETQGVRYLADDGGTVIGRMDRERTGAWRLPAVQLAGVPVVPGEQIESETMQEALALIAELELRGGWRLADVTVKAGSLSDLTLRYADREVRIGDGNYDEKLRRLSEVLADLQHRGVQFSYVDLRSERQAAVMTVKERGQGRAGRR